MKSYYDILEVSEEASKEIIEKAYKTLAKMYHPDLQDAANKDSAEASMKKINEAYEVLINDEKRAKYDNLLKEEKSEEFLSKVKQYNEKHNIGRATGIISNANVNRVNNQNVGVPNQNTYRNNYYTYRTTYSNSPRSILKNIQALLITSGIIIVTLYFLWIIPPTRKWLIDIYNQNFIIQALVDMFMGNRINRN